MKATVEVCRIGTRSGRTHSLRITFITLSGNATVLGAARMLFPRQLHNPLFLPSVSLSIPPQLRVLPACVHAPSGSRSFLPAGPSIHGTAGARRSRRGCSETRRMMPDGLLSAFHAGRTTRTEHGAPIRVRVPGHMPVTIERLTGFGNQFLYCNTTCRPGKAESSSLSRSVASFTSISSCLILAIGS